MPRSQQARYSFATGVLTPRVSAQPNIGKRSTIDIGGFEEAMEICENFIISPQGGLLFREGFEYRVEASVLAEENRLFQFHRGGDISDLIVEVSIGDSEIHLYQEGFEISTAEPALHTYTSLDDLYFTNQEVTGVICSPEHPPYYLEKSALTDQYSGFHMPTDQIPAMTYFDSKSPSVIGTDSTYTLLFPASWDTLDQYRVKYGGTFGVIIFNGEPAIAEFPWSSVDMNINASYIHEMLVSNQLLSSGESIVAVTPTDVLNYTVTLTGKNAGKAMVIEALDGQEKYLPDPVAQTGIIVEGNEPAWSYPLVVLHNAVYYQCLKPHLSEAINEPGLGAEEADHWLDLGASPPPWFAYSVPLMRTYYGTAPPGEEWQLDVVYANWDRGFPEVGVFHQQRLIFMAAKDVPTAIWGSRIGDYHDFVSGVNANDPFEFDLDTSDAPKIKWAESQQFLVIGTSSGDFRMSAEVVLGPGDIQVLKQNNARSHHTRAVTLDTNVMYVEQGKAKLRSTTYLRDVNAWTSDDISLQSEHLLHPGLKRIVVNHTPEAVIYGLLDDGTVLMLSYIGGSLSWVQMQTTGTVIDIAGYYNATREEDELYATITYDGGTTHYIQKMNYPKRDYEARVDEPDPSLSEQGMVFQDAWVAFNDTDVNLLPIFWFKVGDIVVVTVDDEWVGQFTVTAGGVQLDKNYTGNFTIGYPYIGYAKTFEHTSGNPGGTGLGTKRRWNRIFVRCLNSSLPKIQGELPPDRTPATIMDLAEVLRMGLVDHEFRDLGWDRGVVEVLQDRPYPLHVLGFFGEYTSNNA